MAEPSAKRAKRECPLCSKWYLKLTDHLKKQHKLDSKEDRKHLMDKAKEKTPDLRVQSKFYVFINSTLTYIFYIKILLLCI